MLRELTLLKFCHEVRVQGIQTSKHDAFIFYQKRDVFVKHKCSCNSNFFVLNCDLDIQP